MSKRFQKQFMPHHSPTAFPGASKVKADLQNAVALMQRGMLVEAEEICLNVVKVAPNDFDALHLLAGLKHQQGQNGEALKLISAALKKRPNEALALSNRGVILNELNRFDEALTSYNKVLAIKPDYAEALNNRGNALHGLKRFDEALTSYRKAIALKPDYAEAFNNRGNALQGLKRLDEALGDYDQAIALKPDYADAFNNRGNVLTELNRFDEALASYNKVLAIKPDYAEALNNRGNALHGLKRFDEALTSYGKAIALKPDYAEAFNNRGNAFHGLDRFEEALTSYDKAIELKPNYAEAFNNRGNALRELNRFDEALANYDQAIALKPNYAEAFNNRAIELLERGRLAEARKVAEQAVEMAPRAAGHYRTLGEAGRFVAGDPHVAAMEELAQDVTSLSVHDQVELHFALAKAYDDLGRSEDAFGQLLAGNALKRREIAYDEAAALGTLARLQQVFTPERIRSRQYVGELSRVPVFIVGMPRSGTTLVEQILASHPQVFGAGELAYFQQAVANLCATKNGSQASPELILSRPDSVFRQLGESYLAKIKRLAPDAAHVVDKMPSNYIYAGLIHLALPHATIIHTSRDPVDTCISCFSKLFTKEQKFTYDLAELGRYYRHYRGAMAHWHRVLPPDRILDVRYEDVVSDLEGQARRIIAHCGLDWDDRCLAFYKTDRPVRTASATQVRQPIYSNAVGRARVYEKFLNPLLVELVGITPSSQGDSTNVRAPMALGYKDTMVPDRRPTLLARLVKQFVTRSTER
jgi:tetratricopeptide (TPR) repeat protein